MLTAKSSCGPVKFGCTFRTVPPVCRYHRIPTCGTPMLCATSSLTDTTVAAASSANTPRSSAPDPKIDQLVRSIHGSRTKASFVITGGAMQAIPWLLSVPGASNTVLDVQVPYSRNALTQLLGKEPGQYCSNITAMDLAKVAYQRAAILSNIGEPIVGVAATCALAAVPIKRGPHRAFVATHDGLSTQVIHLEMAKGSRSRLQEDTLASQLLLQRLAVACDIKSPMLDLQLRLAAVDNGSIADSLQEQHFVLGDPLEALLDGRVRSVEFSNNQVVVDAPRRGRVYLPGSFNPLHEGHKKLLAVACGIRGKVVEGCFELSVGNADKGQLPLAEIRRRVQQFIDENLPVVVTSAPLFINKANLFSDSSFVVGFDTAHRLLMPKYYNDSQERMLRLFDQFRHAGCGFIVAGRRGQDGEFKRFEDLKVLEPLKDLFTGISEQQFRIDISSTELRQRMGLTH